MFWLASVALLSWPLRVFAQYKIAYVHYYIHKVFGVGGGRPDTGVADSCSDVALPNNNNTLIPSYSEAMRMDRCGRTESLELLRDASAAANVELGAENGSAALVPLLQGFGRPGGDVLSASSVATGRTVYGTVVYDRAGRAFLRSARHCRPPPPRHYRAPASVQPWSTPHGDGPRSSRRRLQRDAAVQKRKRRRSYNEAVGAPSGSDTSLAVSRVVEHLPWTELAARASQRRRRTHPAVRGLATSVSTPESFDKLQSATAWVEQLRHVKSFVIQTPADAVADDNVGTSVDHQSESRATDADRAASASADPDPPAEPPAAAAYDVVGGRVVRCRRRHWVDDDDDDDLPPSYEDALRMRVVAPDHVLYLDDISHL